MSTEKPHTIALKSAANYAAILAALVGLYYTTSVNYLLFHSLAEIFSIVVAFSIFAIAWNSKKYIRNPYLLLIGIAYLFIALIDLLHTFAYKGMPIFTDYDYYANQLWIGGRYLESLTLLLAFFFLRRGTELRPHIVFAVYTVITALLIASIFHWKIFPACFVEGSGLTPFKKISEYIICLILAGCVFLLYKNRQRFTARVFWILLASIICTILSEISFTLYSSNYGFLNLVGHYFKIFSYLLIYEALIKTCIEEPFDLIFLDLEKMNADLKKEIEVRRKAEKQKENLIGNLQLALEEITTLQGLLPICSFCKSIRDDKGYWNSIDSYFSRHSKLEFSHGLCPQCAEKHYPDIFNGEE